MARINLSLEDALFSAIAKVAAQNNTTVNLLIMNVLEDTFFKDVGFDYAEALRKLIEEAQEMPDGEEFWMAKLPSFSALCVSTAENGYLQPSTLRARLGKAFNAAVQKSAIPGVHRAKEKSGELKFHARAAVYVREEEENK